LSWDGTDTVWDMFLREVKRQNRNGTHVSSLQLVHNDWDAAARLNLPLPKKIIEITASSL
jgi:hypothetical protein